MLSSSTRRKSSRGFEDKVSLLTQRVPTENINTKGLTFRAYRSIGELEKLRPAWDRLLQVVPRATIFSTWEWLSSWWHAFGDDRELLTFASFDSNGALIGLAPLSLETHRTVAGLKFRLLSLMGDGSGDSDNLDLIVRPGEEQVFMSALLEHLRNDGGWDFARFNTLPDNSPTAAILATELAQRRWTWFQHQKPGTVIDLPGNWEVYRKQLSYNERGQLGKYIRRLERKYKVAIRKCSTESELVGDLSSFVDLHQRRWQANGRPGSFVSAARRQFYRELSSQLLCREWLDLWTLELDSKAVASEFDFRYRDTVYCLQVGFDPEYSEDRVGYALRGHLLRQFINEGVSQYDFLAGDGGYKDRWGGRSRYYHNIEFALPGTRGCGYLLVLHSAAAPKEWLRRHVPPRWRSALQAIHVKLGNVLRRDVTREVSE